MRSKQKSMEKYPKIITFMLEKRFFVTKNCYEKVDDIPKSFQSLAIVVRAAMFMNIKKQKSSK